MNETTQLLQQWRDGDKQAWSVLLEKHRSFVHERARQLLGTALRAKLTSEDIVQEAMLEFLINGPTFVPENGNQFRAFLGRVVANKVADQGNFFAAQRRRMTNEKTLETVFDIAGSSVSNDPVKRAELAEMAERLRLAMELLSVNEQRVIILREWDKLEYSEIGKQTGQDPEAARSSMRRAKEHLRNIFARIGEGKLDEVLDEPFMADA